MGPSTGITRLHDGIGSTKSFSRLLLPLPGVTEDSLLVCSSDLLAAGRWAEDEPLAAGVACDKDAAAGVAIEGVAVLAWLSGVAAAGVATAGVGGWNLRACGVGTCPRSLLGDFRPPPRALGGGGEATASVLAV